MLNKAVPAFEWTTMIIIGTHQRHLSIFHTGVLIYVAYCKRECFTRKYPVTHFPYPHCISSRHRKKVVKRLKTNVFDRLIIFRFTNTRNTRFCNCTKGLITWRNFSPGWNFPMYSAPKSRNKSYISLKGVKVNSLGNNKMWNWLCHKG